MGIITAANLNSLSGDGKIAFLFKAGYIKSLISF
jgi:hypothetical protein